MRLQPVGPPGACRAVESKGIPQPDEFVGEKTATRRGHCCFWEECDAFGSWPRPLVGCMRLKGQILRPGETPRQPTPSIGRPRGCRYRVLSLLDLSETEPEAI